MSLFLHAYPPSPRSFKVLLLANHLELDYQLKFVDLRAGEQRAPERAHLNINQRVPVLEDGDYLLWESNAILEYLAALRPAAGLLPQELKPRLQVTKWLYWESAHWDPACAIFIFERVVKQRFRLGEENPEEIERGKRLLVRSAQVLDAQLQTHAHIAGEQPRRSGTSAPRGISGHQTLARADGGAAGLVTNPGPAKRWLMLAGDQSPRLPRTALNFPRKPGTSAAMLCASRLRMASASPGGLSYCGSSEKVRPLETAM